VANSSLPIQRHHRRTRLWRVFLPFLPLILAVMPASRTVGANNALQQISDSYELVAENDQFQLYIDTSTLAFKLLDKRSEYLWHSGLDELLEDDRLNTSWEEFARGGISLEYLDAKAVNKRISLGNTEHTLEVTPIDQGISALVTFPQYSISVGLNVQLETEGIRVEVPFETISEEDPNFRIGRVYVYPFLGAVRGSTVPGYMFVPDGTGSLIPFGDSTKAENMFIGRYYGPDLGMIAIQPYDPLITSPYPISFPVFGMVHDDEESPNAFISVVEKGAAYGEVQVHPAGIITNFNFIHNAFLYHQAYFQATNRSGAGVTTVQRQINTYDAVMHYRFLTGEEANYVGMARSYQQYLVENGSLQKLEPINPNIGMRLEFLGGDKERVLLWNRFVPMTTLRQISDILAGLQLPNPEVIYYGWQPSGASSVPPTSLALDGGLGNLNELRALAESITASGGRFSLYLAPHEALWNEPGYSTRNDLAMAITNVNLEGYTRYPTYYFNFDTVQQRYSALSQDIASQLQAGLALDSIGSVLFSDFRDGNSLNRQDALLAYQTLLAESPLRLGFYRPNDYLFSLAQAYYDMPLGDNGYIYTSEAVPFLPIVLAGHLPYYGTPLNFSSNRQADLLRHIEYGIYPSYFLTQEPTANMLNTPSAWIYTSSYDQWGEEIRQTYQWMNELLTPVLGQQIVGHEALARRVFVTTYANGMQIIVNYNDNPFVQDGITVEGQDALLVENQP
jgi:hypothetical protein